jgi:uncharacterized protein YkwD
MRRLFGLAAMLAASAAMAQEGPASATLAVAATSSQQVAAERPLHRHPTLFGMLTRSNNMRRRVGLLPHRMNPALTKAAQDHANYMARTGQFSHYVNGNLQYRANKFGFRGGVRENIAMNGGGLDNAFAMWQGSGAHYASIVSGTSDAGFGYAVSASGTVYYVGLYGTPAAGDEAGEKEEDIAAYLDEEKKAAEKIALAKTEAEKTAAVNDPNVKPASATISPEQKPAHEVKPAAATESTEAKKTE